MDSLFNFDAMPAGTAARLYVSATNPDHDSGRWTRLSPVMVARDAAGFHAWPAGQPDGQSFRGDTGHAAVSAMLKAAGAAYPCAMVAESDVARLFYRQSRHTTAGHARAGSYASRPEDKGRDAAGALAKARKRAALAIERRESLPYVPAGTWSGRGGSDGQPHAAYGITGRFIERPEDRGLQFVGLAGDIAGRYGNSRVERGSGWYLDDDCGEVVRGVVYQLPGAHGRVRYLAGYADPWNCDKAGRGPAFLSLELFESDAPESSYDTAGALLDAEAEADRIAERMAEAEREYQAADRAGRDAREAMAGALALGKEAVASRRAICVAFRERWQAVRDSVPAAATRAWIRDRIGEARDQWEAYAEAREAAFDKLHDSRPGRFAGEYVRDAFDNGYREGV